MFIAIKIFLKKSCRPRGPPEPGGPCHGIIGILVNSALAVQLAEFNRHGLAAPEQLSLKIALVLATISLIMIEC